MDDVQRLFDALGSGRPLGNEPLTDPLPGIRARRRRRRVKLAAAFATAAAVVAAAATILPLALTARGTPSSLSAGPSGSVDVAGSGTVVASSDAVVFCPSVGSTWWGSTWSGAATATSCGPRSVRVTGVDMDTLTSPRRADGVTTGEVYLRGRLQGDTLTVTSQGPPLPASPPPAALNAPPCSTPAGGWSTGPAEQLTAALAAYKRRFTGDITYDAQVPAAAGSSVRVLVIASTEPARTAQELAGQLPHRVCVVPSAFSSAQVSATLAALDRAAADPASGILAITPTATSAGQPLLAVSVLATATARLPQQIPTGLLDVRPWLVPATD